MKIKIKTKFDIGDTVKIRNSDKPGIITGVLPFIGESQSDITYEINMNDYVKTKEIVLIKKKSKTLKKAKFTDRE